MTDRALLTFVEELRLRTGINPSALDLFADIATKQVIDTECGANEKREYDPAQSRRFRGKEDAWFFGHARPLGPYLLFRRQFTQYTITARPVHHRPLTMSRLSVRSHR